MGMRLGKEDNETWLEAALRVARPYGLETEVKDSYNYAVSRGEPEDKAAWDACYEWDVLEYVDDTDS